MCVMKVPVKSWLCCLSVNGSKWARNSTFTFKPSSRWLVDWRRHPIIKRHGLSLSASVSLLRLFCEPWVHIDTRRGDTRCKHSVCVWSPVVLLSIEDTGHFLPSQMSLHLSTNESHDKKKHKPVLLSRSERQRAHRRSHSLLDWSATQSVTTAASQTQFAGQILLFRL